MRICRINRGSLKVFLCRDMHDVIVNGKGQDQNIGLSAAKCFTASVTKTRYK